jgi:hypothetical protein
MKFSVVTPSYNQARFIRQSIESVLSQSHGDLELWVIDNASTDGTQDILAAYSSDPRFHWISEPDRGQSDAINKGLARCTGDVWNWINADDFLAPGALATVAAAFAAPDTLVVSGTCAACEGESGQERFIEELRLKSSNMLEEALLDFDFCQPPTFWKTECVRALGGVCESLHYVMDLHLWFKFILRHNLRDVRWLDHRLAWFRYHPAAKSSTSAPKFLQEIMSMVAQLLTQLGAPRFLSEGIRQQGLPGASVPPFDVKADLDVPWFVHQFLKRHEERFAGLQDRARPYLWDAQRSERSRIRSEPPLFHRADRLHCSLAPFNLIGAAEVRVSGFVDLLDNTSSVAWELAVQPFAQPTRVDCAEESGVARFSATVRLSLGLQRLTISCRDAAGNVLGQSARWIFRFPRFAGIARRLTASKPLRD